MVLGLFQHTEDGAKALAEVLRGGVATEAIRVVGDLGIPAGEAGAMHHVTLDTLHVPGVQRGMFMEGIREGGVVLAVDRDAAAAVDVEGILRRQGALLVEWTSEYAANPSHHPSA
jgi:hypothetical protein